MRTNVRQMNGKTEYRMKLNFHEFIGPRECRDIRSEYDEHMK